MEIVFILQGSQGLNFYWYLSLYTGNFSIEAVSHHLCLTDYSSLRVRYHERSYYIHIQNRPALYDSLKMKYDKETSHLNDDIRIIIRDPLGFKTGIMIDKISYHICPSDHSVRIYGMMYAYNNSVKNPSEPEIYYYFLDNSEKVLFAGRGEHYGTICVNDSAPFIITLADDCLRKLWNKTKSIILFASY